MEVVIVIGLASLILLLIGRFSGTVTSLDAYTNQKLASREDVQQTFEVMITDIRSAGPSAIGAYAIESASTSSLVFFSDVNNDGIADRVRYFLSSSTVMRGVVRPTGTPLAYVTSTEIVNPVINYIIATSTPLFRYYDSSYTGNQTSSMPIPIDIPSIRAVQIQFYSDINPAASTPRPEFFSQTITVRNLRSN
jgi:hypothetical protein